MNNPWETIALSDYENHMSLESVSQLQVLNRMMGEQHGADFFKAGNSERDSETDFRRNPPEIADNPALEKRLGKEQDKQQPRQ